MEKDKYFLIYNSDGNTHVRECSKEALETELNLDDCGLDDFFEELGKENHDTNYWGNKNLLIKGKIITPIEERVVVKRTIE